MKIFFAVIIMCVGMVGSLSAQTSSCLDLSINLSRGAESGVVLSLQNFLFSKGILKVTPNGYFGPSTFAAVKAYQKARGFSQVGNTGPMTRAAIKKDSCASGSFAGMSLFTPAGTTTVSLATTTQVPTTPYQIIAPVLDSIDSISLFSGGQTDWTFDLHGSHFAASGNAVTFKNLATGRFYYLGLLPSSDGQTITIPKNFSGTAIQCGGNCKEVLPAGLYEVTTSNFPNGPSNARTIEIKSFTSSALTSAVNTIPASATHVQLGMFSFSASQTVLVKAISFTISTSTISSGGIRSIALTDQVTGQTITGSTELQAIQSGIIGAYADISNTKPGDAYGTFSITIQDYIGEKDTRFTSSPILMTIAGVL